jgi:hypothetical protein
MLGISTTNVRVGGFRGKGVDANALAVYNRIIADGGVSNLTRLNFFVKGLKAIYGDLANVPVCYDAHWIGYKLGSGTGATAGQAAAKLYSLTVAGDAVQSTAASQPLLLSHNGDNYWWGSGVSGNYVSTPNAAANQITGDIEIIANFKLDSLSADSAIIAKDNISSRLYNLIYIGSGADSGKIYFGRNIGGTFGYSISSVISGFTTSTIYWLKVNRSASTGDVKFFTSTDGITYTQLGATITSTAGVMTTGTVKVNVGALSNDNSNIIQGKIYRATISNSIGGAPVVDFNPAQYNAATSQTAWTSSTGEVWTINTGTATSGYKGVLVDRTIVQGDGVDDVISVAISGNAIRTQYLAHKSLGANTSQVGGLFLAAAFSQAFSYNSNKYDFYQQGPASGPFGAVVAGTTNRALRISGAVGGTGTDWIPFQNGVDVSNGGANIGLSVNYNILTLFSRGNITNFDNAIFNTYIMSSTADNLTIRTATQAFAKTLNNNI